MGQVDINATDRVRHIVVSYEVVPLKYDILMWYSKLISTCLMPRLTITSNILRRCFDKKYSKSNNLKSFTVEKVLNPN